MENINVPRRQSLVEILSNMRPSELCPSPAKPEELRETVKRLTFDYDEEDEARGSPNPVGFGNPRQPADEESSAMQEEADPNAAQWDHGAVDHLPDHAAMPDVPQQDIADPAAAGDGAEQGHLPLPMMDAPLAEPTAQGKPPVLARLAAPAAAPEPVQVMLRLRPLSAGETAEWDRQTNAAPFEPCLQVAPLPDGADPSSANTLVLTAPKTSWAFKNGERQGTFQFSRVLGPAQRQEDVFRATVLRPVRDAVFEGKSASVFAYGMTNAGKTFTIVGSETEPGVLPRAISALFACIRGLDSRDGHAQAQTRESASGYPSIPVPPGARVPAATTSRDVAILVSYFEVYNEQCFDLLGTMNVAPFQNPLNALLTQGGAGATQQGPLRTAGAGGRAPMGLTAAAGPGNAEGRVKLDLHDGRDGRTYLRGARHVLVRSPEAALAVMSEGKRNKAHAETALNSDSSRSHTIFTMGLFIKDKAAFPAGMAEAAEAAVETTGSDALIQEIVNPMTGDVAKGYIPWSRVSIVDLAGSERQKRTENTGQRSKEANAINLSLMKLMNCFNVMKENQGKPQSKRAPVPFRESKLTRFFSDALGGLNTGNTIMLLCAGPSPFDYDETLHAVKYGALVKDIKVEKEKVVTRWDQSKYDENGRRIPTEKERLEKEAKQKAKLEAAAAAAKGKRRADSLPVDLKKSAAAAMVKHGGLAAGVHSRQSATSDFGTALAEVDEDMASDDASSDGESVGDFFQLTAADAAAALGSKKPSAASLASFGSSRTLTQQLVDPSAGSRPRADSVVNGPVATMNRDAYAEEVAKWETEREELEEALRVQTNRVQIAMDYLEDANAKAESIEAEVREEVAAEMATRIAAMEAEWKAKLAAEKAKFDEKFKRYNPKAGRSALVDEAEDDGAGVSSPEAEAAVAHDAGARTGPVRKRLAKAASGRSVVDAVSMSDARPVKRARLSTASAQSGASEASPFPVAARDARLLELEAVVRECEQEISRLEVSHATQLAAVRASLVAKEREVETLRVQVDVLTRARDDAVVTIRNLELEVEELEDALQDGEDADDMAVVEGQAVQSKRRASGRRSSAVASSRGTEAAAVLQQELAARRKSLETVKELLTERNTDLDALRMRTDFLGQELGEKEAVIADQTAAMDLLRRENEQLKQQATTSEAALANLKIQMAQIASTSVTNPVVHVAAPPVDAAMHSETINDLSQPRATRSSRSTARSSTASSGGASAATEQMQSDAMRASRGRKRSRDDMETAAPLATLSTSFASTAAASTASASFVAPRMKRLGSVNDIATMASTKAAVVSDKENDPFGFSADDDPFPKIASTTVTTYGSKPSGSIALASRSVSATRRPLTAGSTLAAEGTTRSISNRSASALSGSAGAGTGRSQAGLFSPQSQFSAPPARPAFSTAASKSGTGTFGAPSPRANVVGATAAASTAAGAASQRLLRVRPLKASVAANAPVASAAQSVTTKVASGAAMMGRSTVLRAAR